jgi:hypothetical protein
MTLLSASEWFLALVGVAVGLAVAGLMWRLPQIEELDAAGEPAAAVRTADA